MSTFGAILLFLAPPTILNLLFDEFVIQFANFIFDATGVKFLGQLIYAAWAGLQAFLGLYPALKIVRRANVKITTRAALAISWLAFFWGSYINLEASGPKYDDWMMANLLVIACEMVGIWIAWAMIHRERRPSLQADVGLIFD